MADTTHSTTSSGEPVYEKDESFYFNEVTFLVEDRLFRVPREYFQRGSPVFEAMFGLPASPGGVDGASDTKPLRLDGVLKQDFRQLLRVMYPQRPAFPDVLDQAEWVSVLKLATMWDFAELRAQAVQRVAQLTADPVEKIVLARTHHVDAWLLPALLELARRAEPLRMDEGMRLGWEYALKLAQLREGFKAHVPLPKSSAVMCYACGRYSGCVEQSRATFDFSAQIRALFQLPNA